MRVRPLRGFVLSPSSLCPCAGSPLSSLMPVGDQLFPDHAAIELEQLDPSLMQKLKAGPA